MLRKISLAVLLISLIPVRGAFSQANYTDYVTITTYYPSPYGVYGKLQSKRLAIGDVNGDGAVNAKDQPPFDGQVYVNRSIIYLPQRTLPDPSVAKKGEFAFNDSDSAFYFFDGGQWLALSGAASLGPGGWNCTVREDSPGGGRATALCQGSEKVLNGDCSTTGILLMSSVYVRPGKQGWSCMGSNGAVTAYANCCK